jgi:hypothetical protein
MKLLSVIPCPLGDRRDKLGLDVFNSTRKALKTGPISPILTFIAAEIFEDLPTKST